MSDTFTKSIGRLLLVLFFILAGSSGYAQYTKSTLQTGYSFTGVTSDQYSNVYAIRYNTTSKKYDVVKYPGGSGSGQVIYAGLLPDPSSGTTPPYGICVDAIGNVFVTNIDESISWDVIKLAYPGYAPTHILDGKFISGVTCNADNDLITLEYDGGSNNYVVKKYPSTNLTAGAGVPINNGFPLPSGILTRFPSSMAVDSRGNIYITDFIETANQGRIIKLRAPWYATDTVVAIGRKSIAISVDAFDRLYAIETRNPATPTVASIVQYTDSSFSSSTVIYNNLHNGDPDISYPGGLAVAPSGEIFAADGTDPEIVKLTPTTTQIMKVEGLNANPTSGNTINFEVTYSGNVAGVNTGSFSITTSGAITGVSIAGVTQMAEPNKYTVTVNTGTGSGTIRLNANANGITPPVSNATVTSPVVVVDKDSPSGTILINGGATHTNDVNVVLTLSATDATSGVSQMRFSVDGGPYTAWEPYATTKNISIPATEANHTIAVTFRDNAGNGLITSAIIRYDITPPATPTIVTNPPNPSNSAGATFTFSAEAGATYQFSINGTAYVATTSPLVLNGIADGSNTLSVKAVDRAGNISAADASYTWTVDTQAPQITQVTVPANGYYKAGMSMDFKVKYNEVVNITNLPAGTPYINIVIGLTTVQVPYTGGTGTNELTFSYVVQAGESDNNGITVNPLVQNNSAFIRDAAGNNASTSLQNIGTTAGVLVNTSIPSVTLSSTAPDPLNAPFMVTVTFNEAVSGLVAGDFSVAGGTAGTLTTADNINYAVLITPTAQGLVSVSLPANTVANIGGNANTASNTLTRTYDATAPQVSVVNVPASGYYRAGQTILFTVAFDDVIYLTGGNPSLSLTIGAATVNATYAGAFGTNGLRFTYTIANGDQDMDGIQVNSLAANGATIRDNAGNNANLTLNNVGNTANVKVNTTSPTVVLTTPATLVNNEFTVTAAFSEAVTGLTESDFTVTNGTASDLQTADNITYTVTITPAANGATTVRLPATAALNIGSNPSQISNQLNVTFDATNPTVTSVTVPANGYYTEGTTLNFTVNFSENVNVNTAGGTPYIAVNMNSGVVPATYTAGTGTSALTFSYTVVAGDEDMDGIELGAGISLGGGGTIQDAATNDATLVLNGVANSSGVLVNTTHPTATITTAAPSPTNAPFTVTITFSEAVTGLATGDFNAPSTTLSNLQTTDNITYTMLLTPTANGNLSLNLPANTALNIASNWNQASNTYNFTYDATAPVVSAVTVPANGYYKAGQALNFTVTFNENITLNTTGGNPTLALTIGAATVNATYTGLNGTTGLNFSYTVVAGQQDMDGIAVGTLSLNGATIRDAATNNATLTLNNVGATANVRVNTTHPTVSLSTAAVSPTNAPFSATITFSEAVTGLTTGDFTVTNATPSNLTTTDNITYTVLVTPTADGTVSLSVPADAAVNIGNNGNQASNTLSLTYDITNPTVTSVAVPASAYYKAGDVLSFTVRFSENITVTGTPQLSLSIGSAVVNADFTGADGTNGMVFAYTVVDGDQDMDGIIVGTLQLNGATIQDAATNNADLILYNVSNTSYVRVNTTNATVVLTAAATFVNAPFTVTATFNQEVTGLTSGDFTVTNGTVANLQTTDNITYTVTVTPLAAGVVTVQLPAAAAVNIGNNPTQVSNTLTVTYDVTTPVVSAVTVPANAYYKAGQTLGFTVRFSENLVLNTTGGTPTLGVVIGTGTVQAAYTGMSGSDGLNFSYTVVNGDQDMNGIEVGALSLNGATIKDAATNNANVTLNNVGATTGVFVNTTHPTVTVSTAAPAKVNAAFTATITFSEAVTGFVTGDVSATNATISNLQTINSTTYTVLVTPIADGTVSLNVPADMAVNIGDNGNQASNTLSLTYDVTAPVVTSVAVPANGYYKAGQALNFTVTFGEDININTTGGTPQLSLTIGTATVTAAYTGTNGTNGLNFSYTVADGDLDMDGITVGALTLNGAIIKDDATNNANLALNNIAPTSNVFVNTVHPTVTVSTTAPSLINTPFTATIIFSEAVTGFAAGDITATNATVSNLTTTDNITYTVLVTPAADGTVAVTVPADAAMNIGDNGNQASNTLSLIYDATQPAVTSVTVPADGYYKAGDVLNFSVKFSENITLNTTGGNPTLSLTIGSSTVNATYTGLAGTDGLNFSYTVVDGDQDMDGIAVGTLTLNGATIKDAATNNANTGLNNVANTSNVKVNTTYATVVLSSAVTLVNAPFTMTVTFSEAVTGLIAGDFTTTNATVSNVQTSDNITYTVTVTPAADGAVTVQLPAAAAVNIGNNATQASNTLTVTYDATAPVVTSVIVPANGYYKTGDVLNFTVNFSENIAINTTGGTPSLNVVLTTGTVQAAYTAASASGLTFSYTVQAGNMDLDGITVGTLTLNGGTIKDAATNNANLVLNSVGNTTGVFVHTASPSVQLSTTAPARVNAPFTVTIVFNEAVTGLAAGDFNIVNGTAASLQTTDNITYTLQVTPVADGTVTIQLPANQALNVVSNGNTASNTLTLTNDMTAPVITAGQSFDILERSATGTQVGKVIATEVAGTLQNWTIATDDSNGAFSIDANGNILVLDQAKLNAKVNSTVTLTVTVSDGLNTSAAVPVTINVLQRNLAPTLDPISNATICPEGSVHTIQLTGASATEAAQTYSFAIITDKPGNFDQLSISAAGLVTYQLKTSATGTAKVTITIKDNGGVANGGVDTLQRSFNITVATLGQVTITSDKGATISKGDIVHLTATGGTTFKWDDADGIISGQQRAVLEVRPMENTTYHVTVSNAAGCSNTADFTVNVIADFKVDATNLLTPNGDGKNDKWVIRNLDSYPDNEVKIFDRTGRLIYTRRNYSNDWDGTYNGSPLTEGTYYYLLTIEGGAKTAKGYITIIRDRR